LHGCFEAHGRPFSTLSSLVLLAVSAGH
jgi:hypothetical protein